jgi:hypothetical protein
MLEHFFIYKKWREMVNVVNLQIIWHPGSPCHIYLLLKKHSFYSFIHFPDLAQWHKTPVPYRSILQTKNHFFKHPKCGFIHYWRHVGFIKNDGTYKFVAKEKNIAQLQTSTWAVNYGAHARGLLFLCA